MGIFVMDIKGITILFLVSVSSAFCASRKTSANQNELAILLTGGESFDEEEVPVEVLDTNGSFICNLPQLSPYNYGHTQSGLTACGFMVPNCVKFVSGEWKTVIENTLYPRESHSSWMNPEGGIHLIGGDDTSSTTEIVYENGTNIRSFDLKYDTDRACSIELPEMFILTGGSFRPFEAETKVSKYTKSGWTEDLPDLNEARKNHGCGFFYNDDMERVFLVVGGLGVDAGDGAKYVSSTETMVEGGFAWDFQKPLLTGRYGLKGVSLPDTIIMTGGYDDNGPYNLDEVLMYDPKYSDWFLIGRMTEGRVGHGASLINMDDVINYCN